MLQKPFIQKSWRTAVKCVFVLPVIFLCVHVIPKTPSYKDPYPKLQSAYCFAQTPPPGYVENEYIDDGFYMEQCSFYAIEACQHIQNQTLLFRLYDGLGFASELNNLLRMFFYAIHNRRKFMIEGETWNYGPVTSFFDLSRAHFSPWLPFSLRCLRRNFVHFKDYRAQNSTTAPLEHLTIARDLDGWIYSINRAVRPLEKTNQTLHMRRIVAQHLWGILNDETKQFIHRQMDALQIDQISYAMHIRRGDKISESPSLPAQKYIDEVEHFMKKESDKNLKRRIYVATDAPAVIDELQQLRPQWDFVHLNQKSVQSSGHQQRSFNLFPTHVKIELTRILITEIEILSRVKYVVCTFSSNVCRLVQTLRKQDPDTVRSLDAAWHAE